MHYRGGARLRGRRSKGKGKGIRARDHARGRREEGGGRREEGGGRRGTPARKPLFSPPAY